MLNRFMRAGMRVGFRARSVDRDSTTDAARVAAVEHAIDEVLGACETERAGLSRRIEDVKERAAFTAGNEGDEYLTRDTVDSALLDALDSELQRGESRLKDLSVSIGHFKFLKAALSTRFPRSAPLVDPLAAPPGKIVE